MKSLSEQEYAEELARRIQAAYGPTPLWVYLVTVGVIAFLLLLLHVK